MWNESPGPRAQITNEKSYGSRASLQCLPEEDFETCCSGIEFLATHVRLRYLISSSFSGGMDETEKTSPKGMATHVKKSDHKFLIAHPLRYCSFCVAWFMVYVMLRLLCERLLELPEEHWTLRGTQCLVHGLAARSGRRW